MKKKWNEKKEKQEFSLKEYETTHRVLPRERLKSARKKKIGAL